MDVDICSSSLYTVHVTQYCSVCKVPEKEAGPLSGVVICVGKKLSKMQSELNAVAASLGADFRYSPHFMILIFFPLLESVKQLNQQTVVVLWKMTFQSLSGVHLKLQQSVLDRLSEHHPKLICF